jgi:protein phosphatase
LNEIFIPRNTLIVLCGPAGCGKSTWAARHFSPTQIVSSDQCRALVSDDPANQQATPQAFQLLNFILQKRLELRRLTVADATSLTPQDRKPFLRLARRFNFHAAVVVFDIPLEVCFARNSQRVRVVPSDAIAEQYALLKATLSTIDSEGFDVVYVLDESMQSETRVKVGRAVSRRPPGLSRQP